MRLLVTLGCGLLFTSSLFSQHFKEVSNEVGLNYNFPGNDHQEIGAGITILDVNNDGWDDIFQACGIFANKLWLNNKGKFIDVSKEYGLDIIDTLFVQGASAADYDNDGFDDLFIGNAGNLIFMGDKQAPILLHNVGGKYFERVYAETFSVVGNYPGAAWGDVNNDGYVDLYLYNYIKSMSNTMDTVNNRILTYEPVCNENQLFINQSGKGFIDLTDEYKLRDKGCGLAASFTDYDLDNDVDLILLNDFGSWSHKGNRIFKNNYPEKGFTDVSEELGFYNEYYGMGIGPGDYNNDGRLDYYATNIGRNYFYVNEVNGFVEKGVELGIDITYEKDSMMGTSWSGLFFDVENDGDVDLFVSKGYLNSIEKVAVKDENKLFLNDGMNGFINVSKISGVNDSLVNRGTGLLDFDHDGDLDIASGLIKMSRGDFANLDQKIKLYENEQEGDNNFIGFKLIGSTGVNTSCIGCRVTFEIGDKKHIREVDGGSGHSSQSSKILYFGVGKQKKIENVKIQWSNGEVLILKKIKVNRVYTVQSDKKIAVLY